MTDTPQTRIQAAMRVDQFLKDEAIGGALARMERRYYEEFIAAETSEARVRAWAKAKMLRDLESELKTVQDAGEVEVMIAARQAAKELPKQ